MCVAIYKPSKASIPKDVLKKCYDQNPHGCGFVARFLKDGSKTEVEFCLKKGFFDFDAFYKEYVGTEASRAQALIHFRIATHGAKNEENSHPHLIDKDHVMVHNGVLHHFTQESSEAESDTRVFVRRVLRPMLTYDPNAADDSAMMSYTEEAIGYNKIIIMRRQDGLISILNEQLGSKRYGAWFSNTAWENVGRFSNCRSNREALKFWEAEIAANEANAGSGVEGRGRYPWVEGQDDAEAGRQPFMQDNAEYMGGWLGVVSRYKDVIDFVDGKAARLSGAEKNHNWTVPKKLGWEFKRQQIRMVGE